KQVGDVHELWRRAGLWAVVSRTLGNANFFLGVTAMAVAFFSLLFALSWGDVSLVAPAAASLTFIGNAFAAKIFLHEKVDRRRWIAAVLVAAGVALLAGNGFAPGREEPGAPFLARSLREKWGFPHNFAYRFVIPQKAGTRGLAHASALIAWI